MGVIVYYVNIFIITYKLQQINNKFTVNFRNISADSTPANNFTRFLRQITPVGFILS